MKTGLNLSAMSLAFATVLTLSACSDEPAAQAPTVAAQKADNTEAQTTANQQLETLYDQAAQTLFVGRPLSATSAGVPAKLVGNNINQQMEDYSPEKEAMLRSDLAAITQNIASIDDSTLTAQERENKEVMENVIRYFSGNPAFSNGYIDTWMGASPFIVNQINGPIIDAPRALSDAHQVNSLQDAQDYITRLEKLDDMINSVESKFLADAQVGWLPPKPVLAGAIAYIERFTSAQPDTHSLVSSFKSKLEKLGDISESQQSELLQRAQEAIEKTVYPAYWQLAKTATEQLPNAKNESGVWAQPNGSDYYQDAILQLGDSQLSADDIHQVGLDEVARISAQMNTILSQQGYSEGSVGARMVALSKEPRFLYEDSEAGRANLLADVNGYIEEMTVKMSPLFKTKPKYEVEVRAFPKETQDSMPGGQYSPPPLDGSIPGIYWINLRDMEAVAKFTLKTLTYHEANPGHHWQISIALEQQDMPFLRLIAPYNAFIEGWALYSEQVADELGMYQDDPFGNLGRLQDELFRAVRLVVDTGLHHKKWTREQAITYMMDITGTPESSCKAEIERYMTWPGQALGYKLGMLKILALRNDAQTNMGERFDLAQFHDLILTGGAVPMSVLNTKIKQWETAGQ